MNDMHLIAAGCLQGELQRIGNVFSPQAGFVGIYDASQSSRQIVPVELRGAVLFALSTLQRMPMMNVTDI